MKTIRTLAAVILATFLVLGPAVAFGATSTMTLQTNAPSYAGQATITISGTVTPAPTITSTAVVLTTKGPAGAVDIGEAAVATGTGAFTYTLVSGGTTAWMSGTYTVNGTWGAQGNTATATTTFAYTSSGTTGGGGGLAMGITIDATTPVVAGSTVYIAVLTSSPTGTLTMWQHGRHSTSTNQTELWSTSAQHPAHQQAASGRSLGSTPGSTK